MSCERKMISSRENRAALNHVIIVDGATLYHCHKWIPMNHERAMTRWSSPITWFRVVCEISFQVNAHKNWQLQHLSLDSGRIMQTTSTMYQIKVSAISSQEKKNILSPLLCPPNKNTKGHKKNELDYKRHFYETAVGENRNIITSLSCSEL